MTNTCNLDLDLGTTIEKDTLPDFLPMDLDDAIRLVNSTLDDAKIESILQEPELMKAWALQVGKIAYPHLTGGERESPCS